MERHKSFPSNSLELTKGKSRTKYFLVLRQNDILLRFPLCSFSFFAGTWYLFGINCSFSNSFPYFTVRRIPKLALPSEFTSSTGARMTTASDRMPSQSGTCSSSAGWDGCWRWCLLCSLVTCTAMNSEAWSLRSGRWSPCYYGGHLFLCKLDFGSKRHRVPNGPNRCWSGGLREGRRGGRVVTEWQLLFRYRQHSGWCAGLKLMGWETQSWLSLMLGWADSCSASLFFHPPQPAIHPHRCILMTRVIKDNVCWGGS